MERAARDFRRKLERVGTSSLAVRVAVDAERMRQAHENELVAEGTFVYVSLDERGRPRPVESP